MRHENRALCFILPWDMFFINKHFVACFEMLDIDAAHTVNMFPFCIQLHFNK